MRYVERRPDPALARFVEAAWVVEGAAGQQVRVLADACTDLIALDEHASTILFNGPMTVASVTTLNAPRTVGMRLRPGILAEVVRGLRLEQIRDGELIVPNPDPGATAEDGLHRFLVELQSASRLQSDPVIDRVLRQMEETPTAETLSRAMRSAPASERALQRGFLKYVGLTPQQTVGVIRQNNVGRALRMRVGEIAELAHTHGYADQSHLTRDFSRLAGLPPGRFAREVEIDGIVQERDDDR